jgi:acetylornithine deacetylase
MHYLQNFEDYMKDMNYTHNKSQVITTLKDLIAIESVNPQFGGKGEAEVSNYIEHFFSEFNPQIERQEVFPGRENIICFFPGKDSKKILLFEAHMDTVSIPNHARSNLVPTVEGKKMYGRGACDTKGSLAAMICAIKSVIEEHGELPISVYFVGAVDEEYRAKGIYNFIKKGITADGAVVGEPTGLDIVIAHKGVYRFQLNTMGKSVQSSAPHNGINAIYKMMDILHIIREDLPISYKGKGNSLVGDPTVSVGIIHGGNEVNTVPNFCSITIDRRVVPGETLKDVETEFQQVLDKAKSNDPEFSGSIENAFFDPPLATDAQTHIVSVIKKICISVKNKGQIVGVPYGSDASKLAQLGIPTIVLGPGDISQAHTAEEYVDLEELEQAEEIYRQLIMKF